VEFFANPRVVIYREEKQEPVVMTEHVSISRMERFCVSGLPENELAVITDHLVQCQPCHELFADALTKQRGSASFRFTLNPQVLFKHDHVDFEQLVDLAEGKLDRINREILEIHLSGCDDCREDVRSFLAFRNEMEPELLIRYGPAAPKPQHEVKRFGSWSRFFPWKPAYAAAFIVILGIAIVVAVIIRSRRAANLEAGHPTIQNNNLAISPTNTPNESVVRQDTPPSGSVPPNAPPKPTLGQTPVAPKHGEPHTPIENSNAMTVIKDGSTIVTIDQAGGISGIDGASGTTRREIADALTAEEIKPLDTPNPLSGPAGVLRGPNRGQPFKLISPERAVILTDRPSFVWEGLRGASSYRVYVGDRKGHEVAKSEELSVSRTRWTVSAPLKRGEIYSWAVAAIVDGKEVFSPGASGPEMKFEVLPNEKLEELNALKKTRSHLVLGVFYAKVGMIVEAEHQFQILIRLNPDSRVLKKLLTQIQSWRRP